MRWFFRITIALVLLWGVYAVSPFVALYSTARAVENRDIPLIEARVNFRAVRISLAKQIVTAYLAATGRAGELKGAGGQLATGLGATLADPILAELVTPEALSNLLTQRGESIGGAAAPGIGGGRSSLADAFRVFADSEARGFRRYTFLLPPHRAPEEQFRLELRLNSSLTWRLTGVELPAGVRDKLVQELVKRTATAEK
ncbi:MAG TPA: DUF2939 domain-containing protein [Beijerinckiaceae bacterium]|jgi:hypothetical protein